MTGNLYGTFLAFGGVGTLEPAQVVGRTIFLYDRSMQNVLEFNQHSLVGVQTLQAGAWC
jgi:hypothetical protein